jgi:hypothetical protein
MNPAIALLHCSASLLIQKQFGGVPIATGVLLVAIPEKIRCKRGRMDLPLSTRGGDATLIAAYNKGRSRHPLSARPYRAPGESA